jgi:hypothetical protein
VQHARAVAACVPWQGDAGNTAAVSGKAWRNLQDATLHTLNATAAAPTCLVGVEEPSVLLQQAGK